MTSASNSGKSHPKFLVCVECGEEFVFTASAQEYFAERGYTEDPKRCKHCYVKYKRDKRNDVATADNSAYNSEGYSGDSK